jgi:hypothetical protein
VIGSKEDPATQIERVLATAFDKVESEIKENGVEKALEKISSLATSFGATYSKLIPSGSKVGKDVVARLIRKITSMRQKAKRIVFFKFLMSLCIQGLFGTNGNSDHTELIKGALDSLSLGPAEIKIAEEELHPLLDATE